MVILPSHLCFNDASACKSHYAPGFGIVGRFPLGSCMGEVIGLHSWENVIVKVF